MVKIIAALFSIKTIYGFMVVLYILLTRNWDLGAESTLEREKQWENGNFKKP